MYDPNAHPCCVVAPANGVTLVMGKLFVRVCIDLRRNSPLCCPSCCCCCSCSCTCCCSSCCSDTWRSKVTLAAESALCNRR